MAAGSAVLERRTAAIGRAAETLANKVIDSMTAVDGATKRARPQLTPPAVRKAEKLGPVDSAPIMYQPGYRIPRKAVKPVGVPLPKPVSDELPEQALPTANKVM